MDSVLVMYTVLGTAGWIMDGWIDGWMDPSELIDGYMYV